MELSLSQAESKYDEYVEMCRNLRDENKLLKDDIEGRSKEQAEKIIEIRKGTMQVEYISQLLLFVDNLQGWIQHDLIGGGAALVPSCVGHVSRPPINLLDYCKVFRAYCI